MVWLSLQNRDWAYATVVGSVDRCPIGAVSSSDVGEGGYGAERPGSAVGYYLALAIVMSADSISKNCKTVLVNDMLIMSLTNTQ